MNSESEFKGMFFGFSSQCQHENEWDESDDEMLDVFHGDIDEVLPFSKPRGCSDDFSMLTSDIINLDGERNEPGSAVPDRYCLAMPRASFPNHCQERRRCEN
jgi:hypothetical protein